MKSRKILIFATGNKAKLAQIRFVVEHLKLPVEIVNGREVYGDKIAYDEIGSTVSQVASHGAATVARLIGEPVITEDTDFRVDALAGAPGIRAGDFLKTFGRPGILQQLAGSHNRRATISSAVGFAQPDGTSRVFFHILPGTISDQERWGDFPDWIAPTPENRFGGGFNAIFIPDGWDRTLAEIGPVEAIPWSYRERNFVDVLDFVMSLDKT